LTPQRVGQLPYLRKRAHLFSHRKLFGQQPSGHSPHEQQTINRPLISSEHRVASAWRYGAPLLDVTVAMLTQRVQQSERFVGCSFPTDSSSHVGRSPLTGFAKDAQD
jgi:hypothetical protein